MNKVFFLLASLCFGFIATAQNNLHAIADYSTNSNWLTIKSNQTIRVTDFFEKYSTSLTKDGRSTFVLINEKTDELGITHSRYAQYINGVEVEGAQFILHSRNGILKKANGRLVSNLPQNAVASLSFSQAIALAKKHVKADYFYWEKPALENWYKQLKEDKDATFYPEEKLVYIDANYSQNGENYKLAYKLDLFYHGPKEHTTVFIDAQNGEVVFEAEGCHTGTVNGVANTKYHGVQDIVTDSVNPTKYVLLDVTRGGGVETYNNFRKTDFVNAQLFEDTDNYWNNFNPQLNEVGTDVHWATGKSYDYYLNEHSRNSYDDLGSKLISYVHYDSLYFNASWNGLFMRYGDGNGNPLTSIDVIGHELSHGVTEYTANLVYAYEPGALNESFSDIFGTAIEFHSFGDSANWIMGIRDFKLRDLSNPNSYGDPDTYLGSFWNGTASDNGGVHTNSGVQNYWYYLLCEGGNGVNDNGDFFMVDSIGMQKASKIAYRNLAYYLTPSSQYIDARQGAIEAAADLYGNCANEVMQTMQAWYAVGVGANTLAPDIEIAKVNWPISACGLGAQEDVSFDFVFHRSGCNDSVIAVGDSVELSYAVNNGPLVTEYFIPTTPVKNNDTIKYTFNQKVDLSVPGGYSFDFFTNYSKDLLPHNNEITNYNVSSNDFIATKDSVTFESGRAFHENNFYFLTSRLNSTAMTSFYAKNTGLSGLMLTGKNVSANLDTNFSDSTMFLINPDYQADFCTCIDATNWTYATLSFDLKQTYSSAYQFLGVTGDPSKFAASMRVVVNGQQIGGLYHPTTPTSDLFKRHFVVLDAYVGQQFELCFQGKHFFDRQSDFTPTFGDNSYIDNIKYEDAKWVSIPEFEAQDVRIMPNPAQSVFAIELNSYTSTEAKISIVDQLGRVVFKSQNQVERGINKVPVDLSGFAAGVYLINIELNNNTVVKKLLLN